jgi:phosphoribosylanthranilate isomerase
MKLKVCGMKEAANIEALLAVKPDFMGLIFYAKSPRNVEAELDADWVRRLSDVKKVGVFVKEDLPTIQTRIQTYGLDLVQLHGQESPAFCAQVQALGVAVIKVFPVGENFDFAQLKPYEAVADYFLFDTKGKQAGGNGITFNWELLRDYPSEKPFFLSGGIQPEHAALIRSLSLPQLYAIDVNSGFETAPGHKDVGLLKEFWGMGA